MATLFPGPSKRRCTWGHDRQSPWTKWFVIIRSVPSRVFPGKFPWTVIVVLLGFLANCTKNIATAPLPSGTKCRHCCLHYLNRAVPTRQTRHLFVHVTACVKDFGAGALKQGKGTPTPSGNYTGQISRKKIQL
eukprot:scaffold12585_cov168-Amphora_coffeaeformis.AAC.2